MIADEAALPRGRARGAAGRRRRAGWSPSASCPTAPETGYGYIKRGARRAAVRATSQRFVEKPDAARPRERYVAERRLLLEQRHVRVPRLALPRRAAAHRAGDGRSRRASRSTRPRRDADFLRLDKAAFSACPADSIDYAVMEKTEHAAVRARSTSAGTTSARGRRCGRWSSRTATATPIAATSSRATAATRWRSPRQAPARR